MKPEMSTAVMIERLRALASESPDGVLLSSAVSRIELLLAAESGMSCEMACIRHALDIPPDQSVQSGVVDAFVRLNAEILELRNQLAEMRGQEPVAWMVIRDRDPTFPRAFEKESLADWMVEQVTLNPPAKKIPLYSAPVPPAVSQPYTVPDERAAYETFIAKRLGDSIDTQRARNGDPEKPDYMAWDMTVGWIAWQGRAAMLQSGNSPVSPDSSVPEGYALVPDGYALVSIDLLNNFPEINICNYNHDDVRELNSWGIELVLSTDQKPISKDGDA
ncbi:hypothetical protein [Pectobacterium versatile]|uniref:hypothetical protein n=1 Tax=Pectobacterium versatile TaxID=2488639 RepID=UPI00398C804D